MPTLSLLHRGGVFSMGKKTVTIPVDRDAIMTIAQPDALLLFSVTRIAWLSSDEEARVRQRCRVLQVAVKDAEALSSDDDEGVIPLDPSWWPLPLPK